MFGIVGEFGLGKFVFLFMVMGFMWVCNACILGIVCFDGKDLLLVFDDEIRVIRGDDVVMIF